MMLFVIPQGKQQQLLARAGERVACPAPFTSPSTNWKSVRSRATRFKIWRVSARNTEVTLLWTCAPESTANGGAVQSSVLAKQ